MGLIRKFMSKFFNIRERKPDPDFTKGKGKVKPEVVPVGYSEEVAKASKGVFSDDAEAEVKTDAVEDGGVADNFPAEGKMTDDEASVLLDMVTEAQKDKPTNEDADEVDDEDADGHDSKSPVIDEDELLPADDSVPDPYGNLMGIKVDEDGKRYAVYDVRSRANMVVKTVDYKADGDEDDEIDFVAEYEKRIKRVLGEDETEETEAEETDAEAEPVKATATPTDDDDPDAEAHKATLAEEAVEALSAIWEADDKAFCGGEEDGEGDSSHIDFRDGDAIEPIGFDAPYEATSATGEMLTEWHLRLVYDHEMPAGDDEPIVELYDGETGEFVSDYWVSQFCDNSDEREGQGLACKGADKRYRIMYDDLVGMQELVRPVEAVEEWYAAHEDDMPDHSI